MSDEKEVREGMPIYEYQCDQCGKIEEALQKVTDQPRKKCNSCSGRLHKLISQSTFHLKGSGWYVTDYAGKTQNKKKKSDNSTTSSNAKSGDSKAADTGKTSSAA